MNKKRSARIRVTRRQAFLPALALACLATGAAIADDTVQMEEVSIIGSREDAQTMPGSAHQLGEVEFARFEHADILRVLRAVPGVYLQEEDGLGQRPNIGIRGSGLDRSARIALLEDGVLIAPAPYAAPAAYYFPTQRRMSGLEVLKGPASVTQGPRTTGGALNLLSTPIPARRAARVEMLTGQDGLLETHAWLGGAGEHAGWLLETVQQSGDSFKTVDGGFDADYQTQDYLFKLRLQGAAGPDLHQALELKSGYTAHDSDETYLGLSAADFAADPYRRYAASQLDHMRSRHRQLQATYRLEPLDATWDLRVTAYRNDFERNWFKLEKVAGIGLASILDQPEQHTDEMAWLRGDADSPDDALTLRNNQREYFSRGVQAAYGLAFGKRVGHELRIGLRAHSDEEDRFQDEDLFRMDNGVLMRTTDGAPGSQANRVSEARVRSLYVEDRMTLDRWQFTAGLRGERIELTRYDFSTQDPGRMAGPEKTRTERLDVLIPGIGASWQMNERWLLLGGIHRGFNPPAPGSGSDVEESINVEWGARLRVGGLQAEAIAFHNAYDNLVGTCTNSTGGNCDVGAQFDGGEATVAGVEALASYLFEIAPARALQMPLQLTYTYTAKAEFETGFESDFSPWGDVEPGDELPYIPRHQLQLGLGLLAERWQLHVNAAWTDAVRAIAGQGPMMPGESTDAHLVADVAASMRLSPRFELFLRVDNLLDETYVAALRPSGLRPGKPRTAMAGFRFEL